MQKEEKSGRMKFKFMFDFRKNRTKLDMNDCATIRAINI